MYRNFAKSSYLDYNSVGFYFNSILVGTFNTDKTLIRSTQKQYLKNLA